MIADSQWPAIQNIFSWACNLVPEKYQGLTENMLNCVNAAKLNGTSRKLVSIIRNLDFGRLRSVLNQICIF